MKPIIKKTLLVASMPIIVSCATSNYEATENLATLVVSFTDSKWDGKTVPKDEVCKRGGAQGSSPELRVNNIPSGTNAIIVEFNDQSYLPLSTGGGHGAIWVAVDNSSSITVPSVATESGDLPDGVNVESKHRGSGNGIGNGVYLAPCSVGRGNLYFADVKAVYKPTSDQESGKLLGQARIDLGRY